MTSRHILRTTGFKDRLHVGLWREPGSGGHFIGPLQDHLEVLALEGVAELPIGQPDGRGIVVSSCNEALVGKTGRHKEWEVLRSDGATVTTANGVRPCLLSGPPLR